jgi:VanZ family protein
VDRLRHPREARERGHVRSRSASSSRSKCGRRRWWLGWVTGIAFTCLIEGAQATLLSPTRFATISDLVTNSLGAGIGAPSSALIAMTIWPPRRDDEPIDHEVR